MGGSKSIFNYLYNFVSFKNIVMMLITHSVLHVSLSVEKKGNLSTISCYRDIDKLQNEATFK